MADVTASGLVRDDRAPAAKQTGWMTASILRPTYERDFRHGDLHAALAKDIAFGVELVIESEAEFAEKCLDVFCHATIMKLTHANALAFVRLGSSNVAQVIDGRRQIVERVTNAQ